MIPFGLEVINWILRQDIRAVDHPVAGYDATSQEVVLRKPQHFCLIMRIVLTVRHTGGMFLFQVPTVKQNMSFISFIITDHTCLAWLCGFILADHHGGPTVHHQQCPCRICEE